MGGLSLVESSADEAREMIQSLPTRKRAVVRKALEAAAQHIKDSQGNYDKAFQFAGLVIENEWLLGHDLERMASSGVLPSPGGDRQSEKHCKKNDNAFLTYSEIGISRQRASKARHIRQRFDRDELAGWLEDQYDAETKKLPRVGTISDSSPHVSNNSGEIEWYTPPCYIESARKVMGGIDVDPASCAKANEVVNAKKFYTLETDGLAHEWRGNVWMNPPYGASEMAGFCTGLVDRVNTGETKQACVLVNNATDTLWFHSLLSVSAKMCVILGRVKFHDSTGEPANTPLQGQVVLYCGKRISTFGKEFSQYGRLLDVV